MLDTGEFQHITLDDAYEHIDNRTVLQWLNELGERVNCHVTSGIGDDFAEQYANYLENVGSAWRGRELGKILVSKCGLCLLLALTLLAVEESTGWKANEERYAEVE